MRITNSQSRRGATIVELAVVLGVFLLILLGLFEYGRYTMVRQILDNAARSGARELSACPTDPATATAMQTAVTATVTGQLAGRLNNPTISMFKIDPTTGANLGAWTNAGFGEYIAVRVDVNYAPLLPTFGILPNPISLRATSIMRSEAN